VSVEGSQPARRVRMHDMTAQYRSIKDEMDRAALGVLERGIYILGPEVEALESEIAERCGARFGIGCNSGTDAILISLLALGIQPGDEVITTPFTFFATGETISQIGAVPVFVDIDPETFCINPDAVASAVTPRTKAIMPVHLYGQAADMDALSVIAERHGLPIIEDAAQAIGSLYKGRPCGSMGHAAALSFYPTKNLGACGDAGMILTNSEDVREKARLLRAHGSGGSYFHKVLGWNSRLDEIQAALLRVKLRKLAEWNESRRQHAALYNSLLAGSGVRTPIEAADRYHTYHQYTIRSPYRDELKPALTEAGVDTGVFYPLSLHLQEVYKTLGYREGDLPEAESAAREALSLPISPTVGIDDIHYVAERIRAFSVAWKGR